MQCSHYNQMIVKTLVFLIFCFNLAYNLEVIEKLPTLHQQIKPPINQSLQTTQGQPFRYSYRPEERLLTTLDNSCHLHPALLLVTHQASLRLKSQSIQKKYSFNKIQNSLFELTSKSITKYNVYWKENKVIQSKSVQFNAQCPKNTLEQFVENKILIFSCDGVYEINTLMMSQPNLIHRHTEQFQSFKVVKFWQLIFEVSSNQGINIYSIDFQLNLKPIQTVFIFKNHTLHITDVYYRDNKLYVLDHKKGVFIFKRQLNDFIEEDHFSLKIEETIQYRHLTLYGSNIYISIQKMGESSVFEGSFSQNNIIFVRYFNGYNVIQQLSIFQNKLLVQSTNKIDLIPINKDPRLISKANNGYTYSHKHQLQLLYYLRNSQFLIATNQKLQIIHLKTVENILQCQFESTGSYKVVVQTSCNKNNKQQFNHVCTQLRQVQISVLPKIKDNYFWLVLISLGIFVLAVVSLIYWRQQEMEKINKILRQIKFLKNKYKESKTGDAIELEEVDHAYSDMVHPQDKIQQKLQELEMISSQKEKSVEKREESEEEEEEEYDHAANVGTERGGLAP